MPAGAGQNRGEGGGSTREGRGTKTEGLGGGARNIAARTFWCFERSTHSDSEHRSTVCGNTSTRLATISETKPLKVNARLRIDPLPRAKNLQKQRELKTHNTSSPTHS